MVSMFRICAIASLAALCAATGCTQASDSPLEDDSKYLSETGTASCAHLGPEACGALTLSLLNPHREVVYATRAEVVSPQENRNSDQFAVQTINEDSADAEAPEAVLEDE